MRQMPHNYCHNYIRNCIRLGPYDFTWPSMFSERSLSCLTIVVSDRGPLVFLELRILILQNPAPLLLYCCRENLTSFPFFGRRNLVRNRALFFTIIHMRTCPTPRPDSGDQLLYGLNYQHYGLIFLM